MTTTQTDALMALADRYAFHIPGSQHSDEARAALLAALQTREVELEQTIAGAACGTSDLTDVLDGLVNEGTGL